MTELPDEDIQEAEAAVGPHSHDGVVPVDDSLAGHLSGVHGLEVDPAMSPATLAGVHDRLHDETDAADA